MLCSRCYEVDAVEGQPRCAKCERKREVNFARHNIAEILNSTMPTRPFYEPAELLKSIDGLSQKALEQLLTFALLCQEDLG